jgi:acyl carrier protein
MDDITANVIGIIAKRLPVNAQKLEMTDRLEELGINSLNVVEMIFDLEEYFGIQISFDSKDPRPEFETVSDVVDATRSYVDRKRQESSCP